LGKVTHELFQTVFPKELAEIEAKTRERGSWGGELTYRRRDGLAVTVSSRWVLRRDVQGNPDGILQSNRDVSSNREAEESRRQSEERNRLNEIRFRLLIDAVKDYAIISLDADGLVTSWNSGAQRMKGYSAEEIVGRHVGRFYFKEDIERGKLVGSCGGRWLRGTWKMRVGGCARMVRGSGRRWLPPRYAMGAEN
jgi:PAS domain-containing protein